MKRLELWRWWHYDPVRKKQVTTRFVLSEADAAVQYPDGAEKVEGSLEETAAASGCLTGHIAYDVTAILRHG